jgi:hypothetical protein
MRRLATVLCLALLSAPAAAQVFDLPDLSNLLPDLSSPRPDLSTIDQATPEVPGQSTALVGAPGGGATERPQSQACGMGDGRGGASAAALVLFAVAAMLCWRSRSRTRRPA